MHHKALYNLTCYLNNTVDYFKDIECELGAQNFYSSNMGSFTGEVNLESLKSIGVKYIMISKIDRKAERDRRHARVRRKISGTPECPRLCVFRSNTNLYAQIIDDVAGNTIVSCSTLDKDVKTKHANKEAAKAVGEAIAQKAIDRKTGARG